jgi:hypothetical protein
MSNRGRVQTERARNKNFTYTPEGQFNSYVESASYFEVFKDPETKTVSLPLLKIFFGEYCHSKYESSWTVY